MKDIIDILNGNNLSDLIIRYDPFTNLKAYICIHSTVLGPAIAGIKIFDYKNEEDAINDAIKLSINRSLRTSISGCDLGGASIVLWSDYNTVKNEVYFRALGRMIESFAGRIIATADLGTDQKDLLAVGRETDYVVSLPVSFGGSGDTSYMTAYGIYKGLKICAKSKYDESSLNKLTIAIQGANNVGSSLIDLLYKEESGIKILLSDHNYDSMKIIQDKYPEVKIVDLEELISSKCDILSPCANGGIINNENYKKLKCKIIAPGAVNILTDDSIADKLYKKDILFAPDFLINAGEVIQIQNEISGLPYETAIESVNELTDTLSNVLRISAEEKIPAYHIAKRIAEERIRNISFIKNIF